MEEKNKEINKYKGKLKDLVNKINITEDTNILAILNNQIKSSKDL